MPSVAFSQKPSQPRYTTALTPELLAIAHLFVIFFTSKCSESGMPRSHWSPLHVAVGRGAGWLEPDIVALNLEVALTLSLK